MSKIDKNSTLFYFRSYFHLQMQKIGLTIMKDIEKSSNTLVSVIIFYDNSRLL